VSKKMAGTKMKAQLWMLHKEKPQDLYLVLLEHLTQEV
jgi:hypothetical protein